MFILEPRAKPMRVTPWSSADAMDMQVGAARLTRMGIPARTTFVMISPEIRPLERRILSPTGMLRRKDLPISLSTALCRPISSEKRMSSESSERAALWTPPVRR